MKSELVSIIVPIYNMSQYLEKCLNSIKIQTYSNVEVFLIDDGSTDSSGEIADKFALEDKRFRVIHLENGGVSRARNKGLDLAQGKYVTFVDSDDYILENHIENLVRNFEGGVSLSICNTLINENKAIVKAIKEKTSKRIDKNRLLFEELLFVYGGASWNKMFELQFIKNNNVRFDETLTVCEDLEFVLRYLLFSNGEIYYSDMETYVYVQRNNSVIHSCIMKNEESHFRGINKCMEMLPRDFNKIMWKKYLVVNFFHIKEKFLRNNISEKVLDSIYKEYVAPIYKEVYASCNVKQKLKLYIQKERMDVFIRLKNIKNKLKKM